MIIREPRFLCPCSLPPHSIALQLPVTQQLNFPVDLQSDPNTLLEAKGWLVQTIGSLQLTDPSLRCSIFMPAAFNVPHQRQQQPSAHHPSSTYHAAGTSSNALPRNKAVPGGVLDATTRQQLLHLWCEQQPAAVAALLIQDPTFLCSYFKRSSETMKLWFGHFHTSGIQNFKFGATALANYALTNRDTAWQLLVWKGRHSQSPVAVANKPYYFCELDVVATVKNLIRGCPHFWTSQELLRCLEAGEWLGLDMPYVTKVRGLQYKAVLGKSTKCHKYMLKTEVWGTGSSCHGSS